MKKLFTILLFTLTSLSSFSQSTYPIYVYPILTPPYSLRLSDYSKPGNHQLMITIHVRDVMVSNLPVRLHIKMENFNGQGIETIPNIAVLPTYLGGGQTAMLFGQDLEPYFNINNLVFKGFSKEQYRRTGQLPEGFYRLTVEVRHFATGRLISNQGSFTGWFALGQPPVLKLPENRAEVGQIPGMPLSFTWELSTPMVPGANVQYTFELWEMRVPGIDPNVYVASMPSTYSMSQFHNSLIIHPEALNLEPGVQYAWRVTASDIMERVPFDQNGRSEVRSFVYQGKCNDVTNLRVERRGNRKDAVYSWDVADTHTSYIIEAENTKTGYHKTERIYNNTYTLRELDFDTTYRLRVRAICRGNEANPSAFTEWKEFMMPAPLRVEEFCENCGCGKEFPDRPLTNFNLRTDLQPGDTIENISGGTRYIIRTVERQSDNTYKGQLWFWFEFYGGAKILCDYWDLKVNTDNWAIPGFKLESVYDPKFLLNVDAAKEFIGQVTDAVSVFADYIVEYIIDPNTKVKPIGTDSIIANENGIYTFIITDSEGNEHIVESETMPVKLEDDSGNIYQINESAEMKLVQESKTVIDKKDDISLYVAIEEVDVNKRPQTVTRYYENGETIILPPGKYKLNAFRRNVEVKETNEKSSEAPNMDNLPLSIKPIKDLGLFNDKLRVRETGENNSDFKTKPYFWTIKSENHPVEEHNGKNDVEYEFKHAGNYTISIQTRITPFPRTTSIATASNTTATHDGWIEVQGISDIFKLNILILDPEPVYFVRGDNYKGEYGFDNFEKTEFKDTYSSFKIDNVDEPYYKPYMSLSDNKEHTIMASTMVTNAYFEDINKGQTAYTFTGTANVSINGSQTYSVKREQLKSGITNKIPLKIRRTGTNSYTNPDIITVKDVNNKIVGQMLVICADIDIPGGEINLLKVYFGENNKLNNPKSAETLRSEAIQFLNNRAFNQAFIKFDDRGKVGELVISNQDIRNYLERPGISYTYEEVFNSQGEIQLQDYIELNVIIAAMNEDSRFSDWQGERTFIVIANRNRVEINNERTNGYNRGNYNVIFNNSSGDYTIYTHELGHVFGLFHLFSDKDDHLKTQPLIQQSSSRNFMDYSPTKDMFWKWQWDDMREYITELQKLNKNINK